MRTYAIAKMRFDDVTAIADSTITATNVNSVSNLELLKEYSDTNAYATDGFNDFMLDGTKKFINSTSNIPFISEYPSLVGCEFGANPTINVSFTTNHSSAGITLYFFDDYPAELTITWYSLSGSKITSKTFNPDRLTYFCSKQVSDYGSIKIEFTKTRLPVQYIKLDYIEYGAYIIWKNDVLQNAKIVEEVNIISDTISNNTAQISILDENYDFDIQNENGAWNSVQRTQEVTIEEDVDGTIIPCGTFFIDKFSFKDNTATFELIDSVGLMDGYTYYNGNIYTNVKAGVILEDIFNVAGVKYQIEEDVYNTTLSGWLAIQTCKSAMQMVCFAVGACADDSRKDYILVSRPSKKVDTIIDIDRKFYGGSKIELDTYISGVSVECSNYVLDTEVSNIYDDDLPSGTHRIEFSKPYDVSSITCTGATIVSKHTNYIDVTSGGSTCTIEGLGYTESNFVFKKNTTVIGGEKATVKEFGTCTLYNAKYLKELTENILDYYTLRKKVDLKYILNDENVGEWVNIMDSSAHMSTTLIESQSIDLTGGFISTATCRGYTVVVIPEHYCGTELYCGEELF